MLAWIIAYLAVGVSFLGLDAIWLSWAAGRLYRPKLGNLLLSSFAVAPAAIFYLIYIAGILVLAVAPTVEGDKVSAAFLRGAMLGLVAYATYDLTNQATLRGWSSTVTVADLCWGTAVTGVAASVGFIALRWMRGHG